MATAASTSVAFPIGSRSLIDYWHLFSLDAPTVAAVWACALCLAVHVTVPVALVLLLALATWLLYAADRILDGIQPADQGLLRERHYFHMVHRKTFAFAALTVLIGSSWLAWHTLSTRTLLDSSLVLAEALAYFFVVHWRTTSVRRWFPKEIAVGTIFAVAVSLPARSQLHPGASRGSLVTVVVLLAALFWLNCSAIESWEGAAEGNPSVAETGYWDTFDPGILRGWSNGSVRYAAVGVMITSAGFFAAGLSTAHTSIATPIYLSVLISAAILFFLDGTPRTLSPLRLRVAADFALLTPLLFLILPRLLSRNFISLGLR